MHDGKIEKWIVIAAFAALAVIVSTEAYALSRSYDGPGGHNRKPAVSVLNTLFERAR
jgi:hypothetical protein